MTEPLQYFIPALSGDVVLRCYVEVSGSQGIVRKAELVHPDERGVRVPARLLSSDYSRDLARYYSANGAALFYGLDEEPKTSFDMKRSWGCSRISQGANYGRDAAFTVPLWTDGAIPGSITIAASNGRSQQTLTISLTDSASYLTEYLKAYSRLLDGRVMNLSSDGSARLYGISLERGGVSAGTAKLPFELFGEYRTTCRFDAGLASMWKNARYAVKQVIPLQFAFRLDDILTPAFKNKTITFSASYEGAGGLKTFSSDYSAAQRPFESLVRYGGSYVTSRIRPANPYVLNEDTAAIYQNRPWKRSPKFCRWELQGNDDLPYIINASESYNATPEIGRYYHTPMRVPLQYALKPNDVEGSIAAAERFYESYQDRWFSEIPTTIFEGQVLHRGIMYNLQGYEAGKFCAKLEIKKTEADGPYVGLFFEPNEYAPRPVALDLYMGNAAGAAAPGRAVYPSKNLYCMENAEANGVPSICRGNIEGVTVFVRDGDIFAAKGAEKKRGSLAYFLELLYVQCAAAAGRLGKAADKYRFLRGGERGYGYVFDSWISGLRNEERRSAIDAAGELLYYKRLTDEGIEFEEIISRYNFEGDVYRRREGVFANISYDGSDFVTMNKSVFVFAPLHRETKDGAVYFWRYSPDCITAEVVSAAVMLFGGLDVAAGLEDEPARIEAWDENCGSVAYEKDASLLDVAHDICEFWRNECVPESAISALTAEDGYPTGLREALDGGNIEDYRLKAKNVMQIISGCGCGFEDIDDAVSEQAGGAIDIEKTLRVDWLKGCLIDEPPATKLYITRENAEQFYALILNDIKS